MSWTGSPWIYETKRPREGEWIERGDGEDKGISISANVVTRRCRHRRGLPQPTSPPPSIYRHWEGRGELAGADREVQSGHEREREEVSVDVLSAILLETELLRGPS